MQLMESIRHLREPQELVQRFVDAINRAYADRAYIQISPGGLKPGEYRVQRLLSESGRDLIDHRANLGATPISRGGIVAELISTPEPKLLHNVDLRNEPQMDGLL